MVAIDDVNTYSDSDSEDEYKGEPFYLYEDNYQTDEHSKNVCPTQETGTNDSYDNTEESTKKSQSPYYRPSCILTASLFPNVAPYLNFCSHAQKGPSIPDQLHKVLKWKLSPVMPKIVKRVVLNSGFRIIKSMCNNLDYKIEIFIVLEDFHYHFYLYRYYRLDGNMGEAYEKCRLSDNTISSEV